MSIALSDWKASALRHPHRGHRVAYFEAGQGEPLLLLHGFPTSSSTTRNCGSRWPSVFA